MLFLFLQHGIFMALLASMRDPSRDLFGRRLKPFPPRFVRGAFPRSESSDTRSAAQATRKEVFNESASEEEDEDEDEVEDEQTDTEVEALPRRGRPSPSFCTQPILNCHSVHQFSAVSSIMHTSTSGTYDSNVPSLPTDLPHRIAGLWCR